MRAASRQPAEVGCFSVYRREAAEAQPTHGDEVRIALPSAFNRPGALDFTRRLRESADEEIEIVHRDTSWVEPFGMLLAVCCTDELRNRGVDVRLTHVPEEGYARHMGLFDALDPTVPAPTSCYRSSDTYIAIDRRPRSWMQEETDRRGLSAVQDFVFEYSGTLAMLLTQDDDVNDPVNQTLQFCLSEILRNIYEHSQSEQLLLCAQYWPKLDRVDMAVADQGIGLRESLESHPYMRPKTDAEAVGYSILPGISGRAYSGMDRHLDQRVEWENSGYGLYLTKRICADAGNFVLCSGTVGIAMSRSTQSTFSCGHAGTILGLRFKPSLIKPFGSEIVRYNREGREEARKLRGAITEASAASHGSRLQ